MIEDLKNIEKTVLMDLLKNPSIWNTLDVNYHHPRVERLWTQVGTSRLMLHVIHTCETDEALYHPHPWPSAMHVLSGSYEMGLGVRTDNIFYEENLKNAYNQGGFDSNGIARSMHKEIKAYNSAEEYIASLDYKKEPGSPLPVQIKQICKIIIDGDNYYEMLNPKGWHYVRPITSTCLSIMLIDEPWEITDDQDIPKAWGKLPSLTEERKLQILTMIKPYCHQIKNY